jgi:predicted nucleic acid-binding protein
VWKSGPLTDELKPDVGEFVRGHIRRIAEDRIGDAIVSVDEESDSLLDVMLPREMPTVVVDANVIRNEFSYLMSHPGTTTTLVNATNARLVRVFAHQQVVEEVFEHLEDWAEQFGTSESQLYDWWTTSYLPLLRVISWRVPLSDLLTPDESARIEVLRVRDADDIPTAMLAIVLGASFISEDEAPVEAVYGEKYNREKVAKWVSVLKAGSSAGEVMRIQAGAILIPTAVGHSMWTLGRDLWRWNPLVAVGLGAFGIGATIALARKTPPETSRSLLEGALKIGEMFGEVVDYGDRAFEEFRNARPRTLESEDLCRDLERGAVLHRAMLQTASRIRRATVSARELADTLPVLGVGQRDQLVRATLRGSEAFWERHRGRWALGLRARPK